MKISSEGQKATSSFRTTNSIKSFQKFETTAKGAVNGVSTAYKRLNEVQQAQVKALQDQQRASLNLLKAERKETVEVEKLRLKRSELVKLAKQQAKEELGLVSAYDKVVAKMNQAGKTVQNLNAKKLSGQNLSNKEQRELSQSTRKFQKYQKAVLGADASIGRFQRNVGNYPKQIMALGSALMSLVPALGIAGGIRAIFDFSKEAVELARQAKGVQFAFQEIEQRTGDAELALIRMKSATRGLFSDLELKRAIVELDNFNISTKEADTLMEFLSVRAAQTGKSIDYLRDGLIEGLSKESKLRIDNLGISASELNAELEKTPDFVQAVANIAKKEIAEAGNILDEAANSQQKFNAAFENFKLEAGQGFIGRLTNSFYELGLAIITSKDALRKDDAMANYLKQLQLNADETIPLYVRQGQLTKELDDLERKTLETREKLNDAKRWDIGLKNEETKQLEILLSQYKGQYEAVYKYKELLIQQNKAQQEQNDLRELESETVSDLRKQISDLNEKIEESDKTDISGIRTKQEKIKELQKELDAILGVEKATKKASNALKGSLNYYSQLISTLQSEQASLATSGEKWNDYEKRINEAKKAQQDFILSVNGYTISFYDKLISDLESQQKELSNTGKEWKYYQDLIDAARMSLSALSTEIKGLEIEVKAEKIADAFKKIVDETEGIWDSIDDIDMTKANASIETWQRQQEAIRQLRLETEAFLKSFQDEFVANSPLSSLSTFFDGTFDLLIAGADTTAEKFAVSFNAIAETAEQTFGLINQLGQQNFDAQYERLAKEKDIKLQFAGESTSAREEIERQYEEKRSSIQRKQAESEKKQALFKVAIDTAQAIVGSIAASPATFGLPFSAFAAAAGLAQAALISSQQIPAFAEGGISEGGDILVNDAKRSNYKEVILTPKGDVLRPQKRNTIIAPPKGSEIFKSEKVFMDDLRRLTSTNNIMFDSDLIKSPQIAPIINLDSGLHKEDFERGISSLKSAIDNKEGFIINMDRNGNQVFKTKNGKRVEQDNNILRLKGKIV